MTDNEREPGPSSAAAPTGGGQPPATNPSTNRTPDPVRPRRRAVVAGSVAAVVVAGAGGGAWWWSTREDPADGVAEAAGQLAQSWSQLGWTDVVWAPSEDAEVPQDGPADVPADAAADGPGDVAAEYARVAGGLAAVAPAVTVSAVDTSSAADGTATATLDVVFDLTAGFGAADGATFAYATTVRLRPVEVAGSPVWRPVWEPALVHPALASGATFVLQRERPERADVLARDGSPVVTATPVVRVGVQPSRTTDPASTAAALEAVLGVDRALLTTRIQEASPDAFVEVITLRRSDYDAQRDLLQPIPGAVFAQASVPLAPTRGFARALLGTVGQATAEIVEGSQGRYVAGDLAGLSGLQRSYDERLAGRPAIVVRAEGGTDAASAELARSEAVPGQPVTTSLDSAVQRASDDALAASPAPAALVAVDVATGDVVAASNFPVDGGDRALTGRFPPGSTFKVVTTLALLRAGLDVEENVPCTPTYTVDGRSFSNFEDEEFGDVTFRTDFALSCNTAFASLSPRLADDDLRTAAAELGVGAEWSPGVDAFAGDVPVTESAVDAAAASFGQGRTLVSPLAMATAAASVAALQLRTPVVVRDPAPEVPSAPAAAADPALLGTVADLMRDVVTGGTATVLADVPGGPVHAKTGTAEYGTAQPPATHAWTIGFQGGLAFAVFVTDGVSGGSVAAPLAADFLRRLSAAGGFPGSS